MRITDLNKDLLVTCHCYAGDKHQVLELLPYYEHHEAPIVVVSPDDSPVHGIGPHICRTAGKRCYTGQDSWDRQYEQLKLLLEYPQKWFLLNDSDSFCLLPKIPSHLLEDDNVVWSNQVEDFRKPGESWQGLPPWPKDYHKGYPLIAMQPPYFLHRNALEKIVKHAKDLVACPICPFIDWWWIPAVYAAGVKHKRFPFCASCETTTELGKAVMRQQITDHQAQFIHSVKSGAVANELVNLYRAKYGP